MFEWLFGKKEDKFKDEVKQSFSSVKTDMDAVGKWVKHLDGQDKQLFELVSTLKKEISTIKNDIGLIHEQLNTKEKTVDDQQVFEKTAVYHKQTSVYPVDNIDQTAVQTANFYNILKNLSSHERLVFFTIMQSDMKLSYEDLALLLGKEKSTIRGQVNSIKQKCEGLIEEISEKNGKKRVFVPDEVKEKLAKYAKVRVGKGRKVRTITKSEEI